jgi:hypothetical protein
MKHPFNVFISLVIWLSTTQCLTAQVKWLFNKDGVVTWYYQEGDEFNGKEINKEYWADSYGWARTLYNNKEQQYYTKYENHEVSNGTLKLSAKKDSITARITDSRNDNDSVISRGQFYSFNRKTFKYKAGMIETRHTFTKGYFECRFKIPEEKGYWPAFWLHGGDPNEEIDMMECKTERQEEIHLETHCPNKCDYYIPSFFTKRSFGSWVKVKTNFVKEFNVVACEWDEEKVRFFLNGECIGISKVKFLIPKLLTLNIAVPSDDGPFKPGPNPGIVVPSNFEVDYVRVWSKEKPQLRTTTISDFTSINPTTQALKSETYLKKKSKFFYGKKEDHANNGIQIDCLPQNDGWQFIVMGNTEGNPPKLEVKNVSGQIVLTKEMDQYKYLLSKSALKDGSYTCVVTWNGLQATYNTIK